MRREPGFATQVGRVNQPEDAYGVGHWRAAAWFRVGVEYGHGLVRAMRGVRQEEDAGRRAGIGSERGRRWGSPDQFTGGDGHHRDGQAGDERDPGSHRACRAGGRSVDVKFTRARAVSLPSICTRTP
ncbi:hypothetical protein C8R44DRAFT_738743 [Mycena epipterygia]|nr:hypothetical protein C8R44DRAFT_738743 [Mycena epipterygia]